MRLPVTVCERASPRRICRTRPASAGGPTRRSYTGARFRPLLRPVDDKPRELGADPLGRPLLFAIPCRYRVGHAEDAEHRETSIEIGAELSLPHTFLDDVLEHALEPARPFPIRRRLSVGRCWRSFKNTRTKSLRSVNGAKCD